MKGRRESGTFVALPHAVLESERWRSLSPIATKLVIDVFSQFRGYNNGDLAAPWSLMSRRGWRSKATLYKAIKQAKDAGMIIVTRQGGRKIPTLYGVTWLAIDECGGRLDIKPTSIPPGDWKGTSVTIPIRAHQASVVGSLPSSTPPVGPASGPHLVH
jgi:hypothetical protein